MTLCPRWPSECPHGSWHSVGVLLMYVGTSHGRAEVGQADGEGERGDNPAPSRNPEACCRCPVGSGWCLTYVANKHIFAPSLRPVHRCTRLNSRHSPAAESAVKPLVTCHKSAAGGQGGARRCGTCRPLVLTRGVHTAEPGSRGDSPHGNPPPPPRVGQRVGGAVYPTWRAGSEFWRSAQHQAHDAASAVRASFHFAWHSSITAAPNVLVFGNVAEFRRCARQPARASPRHSPPVEYGLCHASGWTNSPGDCQGAQRGNHPRTALSLEA